MGQTHGVPKIVGVAKPGASTIFDYAPSFTIDTNYPARAATVAAASLASGDRAIIERLTPSRVNATRVISVSASMARSLPVRALRTARSASQSVSNEVSIHAQRIASKVR